MGVEPSNNPSSSAAPLEREEVQVRFKPRVHEFICPSVPDRAQLGPVSVFAGGGITNCADWQEQFGQLLNERIEALNNGRWQQECYLSLLNPRRTHFPIGDPNASPFQIEWEYRYLDAVKAISLWFPNSSEGPISLFETGKWMLSAKPFFVGIEEGYPRTQELLAHLMAVRPNLIVATTLSQHAENVARWALGMGKIDLPITGQIVRARSLYLLGGIDGCPDWQGKMEQLLTGAPVLVDNPRIENFVKGTPEQYRAMVRQNRERLERCEGVVAWFPKEQMTPVALLELGSLIASGKPLFIGVEPGYRREIDVRIQTKLARPEIDVVSTLEDLSAQVWDYYGMRI